MKKHIIAIVIVLSIFLIGQSMQQQPDSAKIAKNDSLKTEIRMQQTILREKLDVLIKYDSLKSKIKDPRVKERLKKILRKEK